MSRGLHKNIEYQSLLKLFEPMNDAMITKSGEIKRNAGKTGAIS